MFLDELMKIKLFTRKLNLQTILVIAVLLVLTGIGESGWGHTQTFPSSGLFIGISLKTYFPASLHTFVISGTSSFTSPHGVTFFKVETISATGIDTNHTSNGNAGCGNDSFADTVKDRNTVVNRNFDDASWAITSFDGVHVNKPAIWVTDDNLCHKREGKSFA